MRVIAPILLCLITSTAQAGGDYALGKIVSFSGQDGNYLFRFVQTDKNQDLMKGCREFNVKVHFERVPWFSWLPFIRSFNPTKTQTESASAYLRNANQTKQEVYFGYMGYGLKPTGESCSFLSKGLSLEREQKRQYVLSYYDQV